MRSRSPAPPDSPRRPGSTDRGGYTLLELATALLVASLALSALLPAARDQRDRMAVAGAREAVAGLIAETRALATRSGGAELACDPDAGVLEVRAGGEAHRAVDLGRAYGVTLEAGSKPFVLRFDPLGIGRVASRTFRLRRGDAQAVLTVSSYGRVRRR